MATITAMNVDLGPDPVQWITCLCVGRIGDVIVTTPFLRGLRHKYPKANIRLIVGHRAGGLAPLIPFIDSCLVLEKPLRLDVNIPLAFKLLTAPCDLLIDLNSSFSKTSSLIAKAARAHVSLSFDKGRGPAVFTITIAAPAERETMSERYARLTEAIDAPYNPNLELQVPQAAQREAERRLAPLLNQGNAAFKILVHPGNIKRPPSFWPIDRLTRLCARLQEDPSLQLFFLAGPGEVPVVSAIAKALPKSAPILPAAPLPIVGGMVKKMNLLMGSLTSTTHLAAALEIPTFAFYEGYTQTVWRPNGKIHGGTVSADWNNVQSTSVDEAYAALKEHLAHLQSGLGK